MNTLPFHNLIRQSLEEELNQYPLTLIKGKIQHWLQGTLIRNGPAKFEAGNKKVYHWFDGLAMLHAFSFNNGHVTYSNRFLRTDAYKQVFDHNSINYIGFASDPCTNLFGRLFSLFFPVFDREIIPNANINVTQYADAYVAFLETPLPVQFDLKTLATIGVLNYQDTLPKVGSWESAHPHIDMRRKETISYLVKFGPQGTYIIYSIAEGSIERKVIAEISVAEPSYMHSFSITDNYIILTEYPFIVNPIDILLKGKGFIQNYSWKPDRPTQFTVINRETGQIQGGYQSPAFFAFHHVNAYEKNNQIIMDIAAYTNADIVLALAPYEEGIKNNSFPLSQLKRYTIDLDSSLIDVELICDFPVELPRIHSPKYNGKLYRYVYGVDLRETFSFGDSRGLYKVDVETKQVITWNEAGSYPGEPVFIKDPTVDSDNEDQGIILCVVLDQKIQKSFLLILDAMTFAEIGRAEVPHHIPQGLHGQYFK